MVASRARQLIGAAETVELLEASVTNVTPQSEAQARELAPLRGDPGRMSDVWAEANGRAGAQGRTVTATIGRPPPSSSGGW